jgi:hypothetical protein
MYVYMCMYACMLVCACVCIYVCIWKYVYIYVGPYVYMDCINIHMAIWVNFTNIVISIFLDKYVI